MSEQKTALVPRAERVVDFSGDQITVAPVGERAVVRFYCSCQIGLIQNVFQNLAIGVESEYSPQS
jgi:hypothetical protein